MLGSNISLSNGGSRLGALSSAKPRDAGVGLAEELGVGEVEDCSE